MLLIATNIYVALSYHKRSAIQLEKHALRRGKLLRHRQALIFIFRPSEALMLDSVAESDRSKIFTMRTFPRHDLKTAKKTCSNSAIPSKFLRPS
jgi:hypothetical protein